MLNRHDALTELGTIKIHHGSIASIAAIAAGEVNGVKCIGKNLKSRFLELLGRKDYSIIRVDFDKNGEVALNIPIVVIYNFNIPETAAKVQENVRVNLEKMTNLVVRNISINVLSIEKTGPQAKD